MIVIFSCVYLLCGNVWFGILSGYSAASLIKVRDNTMKM